jgi:hypothetical protein
MNILPDSITFKKEIGDFQEQIIIPEDFIKDCHFSSNNHLMDILRVIGDDSKKVISFSTTPKKKPSQFK